MGMNTRKKRGAAISEINVTPLVDVMLVLLIVFMVTVPSVIQPTYQRKVDMNLPTTDAKAAVTQDELQTVLLIHPDFTVGLDLGQGESPLADCSKATTNYLKCLLPVETKLGANEVLKDGRRLFLMADRALPYGFIVDVMARVKNAGITNLGMVTNPPPQAGDPG